MWRKHVELQTSHASFHQLCGTNYDLKDALSPTIVFASENPQWYTSFYMVNKFLGGRQVHTLLIEMDIWWIRKYLSNMLRGGGWQIPSHLNNQGIFLCYMETKSLRLSLAGKSSYCLSPQVFVRVCLCVCVRKRCLSMSTRLDFGQLTSNNCKNWLVGLGRNTSIMCAELTRWFRWT